MLSSSPALNPFSVKYPYPIPMPYKCTVEESCKGGLDSPCAIGYEGPLCAVCSSGYYKQLQICTACPSKKWIAAQLSIIAVIIFIIIAVLAWTNKRKEKKAKELPLIDRFFSKLKIVIGFYQVTYGLLEIFSYVKWPDSLEGIAKYSGILQLNILQIAPIQCLFMGLQVDAFGSLFATMAVNTAVIALSGVYYGVRRALILKSQIMEVKEKSTRISQTKELVYKNLFFVLYVTYLSTRSKTAAVLPLACQELCRDRNEEFCHKYLKADYMTKCQGSKYQYLLIGAYISAAYVIALPAASFIALWRHRRELFASNGAESCHKSVSSKEMITGLRFLFENYKPRSWYWELVEMSRKVILTSALILVGQESRSYIGLTLVIAGMYGMLFSWIRPMQDAFDNRLMSTSLAVTIVNLAVGAVSRIPTENTLSSKDQFTDAVLFKILVLGANVSVIGLLVVQYTVILHRYLTEWCKNPHCSLSCCLALLLPLNDLQGEIHGLAESNVVNEQLETGQMDTPTVTGAVQDSGAIDTVLKTGQQGVVAEEDHCQKAQRRKRRYDKGIQTDHFEPSYAGGTVHGLKEGSLLTIFKKSLK